jgi:condensin-2 complex subunit H2
MGSLENIIDFLQPIKDLAINWDIDIATSLEEYLEELESIQSANLNKKDSLNFAEAAILIQGSTAVYSRKVEYLHTLVLQALDFIKQQKSDEKVKSLN